MLSARGNFFREGVAERTMPKVKTPPQTPRKPTATERMIEECVAKAKARKKSGQTDQEWRKQYAATLKVTEQTAPFSETPFAGDTKKQKV